MLTQERRKSLRLPNILPVQLNLAALPKRVAGTARNISEGGMFVEALLKEELPADIAQRKPLSLKVDLSPEDDQFESLVKIVWLKQEKQENIYQLGMQFIKTDPAQRRIISTYISKEAVKMFPASLQARIAHYILYSKQITTGWRKRIVGELILFLAGIWIKRQRISVKESQQLSKQSIRKLYDFEAKRYLHRHARTTCRNDDACRLWLAQMLLTKVKEINRMDNRAAQHIDIFAGTGLSYLYQAKVFYANNANVNSLLLDYSPGMLKVAKEITIPQIEKVGYASFVPSNIPDEEKIILRKKWPRTVELLQGDATNLGGEHIHFDSNQGNTRLPADYFDAASIMFGIGGVSLNMALSVSRGLLGVLKLKGRFAITDMHRPVAELAGRWGWPAPVEFRWPWFEKESYRRKTVPYVLNRLWGWHDPTLYPHLMKLSVIQEKAAWYGWEEISFVIESLTWDFGMPVMPVYKQVLRKEIISEAEAIERTQAIKALIDAKTIRPDD